MVRTGSPGLPDRIERDADAALDDVRDYAHLVETRWSTSSRARGDHVAPPQNDSLFDLRDEATRSGQGLEVSLLRGVVVLEVRAWPARAGGGEHVQVVLPARAGLAKVLCGG